MFAAGNEFVVFICQYKQDVVHPIFVLFSRYGIAGAVVVGSLSEQIWDPKIPDRDERLDDGTCDIDTADALEYSFSKFIKPLTLAGGENI